ncbi:MAG: papain-like cysteine protease family protein [Steroidobacter sp.]
MKLEVARHCLFLFATLASMGVQGATTCQDTINGRICTAQVNFAQFAQQAFQNQLQEQWCWAAAISMVYAFAGHPVAQSRIVAEAYGAPVNIPAPGMIMARQLNRTWVDDDGQSFVSQVSGLYDADAGVLAITDAQIISELDRNRPLIIGAGSHAMVLTAIQYYNTISGPVVVGAGVFDPWPGVGARGLRQDEIVPMHLGGSLRFLAAISVSNVGGGADISNSDEGGGGASSLLGLAAAALLAMIRVARKGGLFRAAVRKRRSMSARRDDGSTIR